MRAVLDTNVLVRANPKAAGRLRLGMYLTRMPDAALSQKRATSMLLRHVPVCPLLITVYFPPSFSSAALAAA